MTADFSRDGKRQSAPEPLPAAAVPQPKQGPKALGQRG